VSHSASASLIARDVCKAHGSHLVLDRVSLTVVPGRCLGIVAPNGAGKTTLLRILAGLESPDSGVVERHPPTATVGYLPQEPDRRDGETLRSFLARRTGVRAAEAALDTASEELAGDHEGADDTYAAALDRYLALGAPDFDARAATTVVELGLSERLLDVPMPALSGGQAARASLAAILLSRFDVLLLDEPTNDLDFAGLDRLERFFAQTAAGVVVVSHDRMFLDRTIDAVLELDEHTHQGRTFDGGWSAYLDERAITRRHAEERYDEYQTKRSTLMSRAQQQREWATQGVAKVKKSGERDKFIRAFRTQSSERLAGKARATAEAVARLDAEAVEKPWEGWDLRLELAEAPRSGDIVARFERAVVQRGDFTLGPLDFEVRWGERVAILGPNGSGKTTLLGVLLGDLPLDSGVRRLGPAVVVGTLDQGRARFAADAGLLDAFIGATGADLSTARSALAKFGLGADHVTRPSKTLSPGERTRAVLALFTVSGVNCLVLDEPTNHLDMPAIEQLEQALETFGGTVLLVTHDRQLLDAVSRTREIRLAEGRIVADETVAELS